MKSESQRCTYEPCQCVLEAEVGTEPFCSDTCRKAVEDEEEDVCPCGHPPCDEP